jgi:L-threonylcarbamoyladenylate synthase
MRVINKDELDQEPKLLAELKSSVFIYPTDTIYGIGCDANRPDLVAKIREMKKNIDLPFSIIIPNKNMIFEYCETDDKTSEWVDKLPGPYTIIMRVKKQFFAPNVNPKDNTVGVRIPNHWFYNYIKKMKVPIVTTSANVKGDDFMTSLENLNPDIQKKVDFIVYDGPIQGRPSTIVNLAKDEVEVKKR